MRVSRNQYAFSSLPGLGALICITALAAGDLDPHFGDNGQLMSIRADSTPASHEVTGDATALPDGRYYWSMDDGAEGVLVGRILKDGSADPIFGQGEVLTLEGCAAQRPLRLAPAVDAGLVVWTGACFHRLGPGGEVEPDFASGEALPSPAFVAATLLRDGSGRWLLGGTLAEEFQVWRFNPDGGYDLAFGDDGVVKIDFADTSSYATLQTLVLDQSGRLVLAGARREGSATNMILMRLMNDGQADTGFGTGGVVEFSPPAGYHTLRPMAVALASDGDLVIVGDGRDSTHSCCAMVTRLHADGPLMKNSGCACSSIPTMPDCRHSERPRIRCLSDLFDVRLVIPKISNVWFAQTNL